MSHPLPHIVFLFSDTGGGHRSAAEAIIGALEQEYAGRFTSEMVDIFRDFAPALLDRVPDIYPPLSRNPKLLGQIFYWSDQPARIRSILRIIWPYIRPALNRLISERRADLFVSVHPLINIPLGHALKKAGARIPWVTVVTDLVSIHTTWFCPEADLIIVPTEAAQARGLLWGIAPERIKVVGLPVAQAFVQDHCDLGDMRARLGWPQEQAVVLLMGGGEGSGDLEEIAGTLDEARLPVTLAVIAGRNKVLQQRLESRAWQIPVRVYGFVQNMPDLMRAASILLTKAGPGTINEAACSGLPMILYSKLDGSEDGNVNYIVEHGAGIWAPGAVEAAAAVKNWLDRPEERARAGAAGLALARPRAAQEIAALIMVQLKRGIH